MKVLLWTQVFDLSHLPAPVPPQKSPVRLMISLSNASQLWGRCVKTAHRSACARLCETRARCPLHKVPRFLFGGAHISDVVLFLRREGRGREGSACPAARPRSVSGERPGRRFRVASAFQRLHSKSVLHLYGAHRAKIDLARMDARNM